MGRSVKKSCKEGGEGEEWGQSRRVCLGATRKENLLSYVLHKRKVFLSQRDLLRTVLRCAQKSRWEEARVCKPGGGGGVPLRGEGRVELRHGYGVRGNRVGQIQRCRHLLLPPRRVCSANVCDSQGASAAKGGDQMKPEDRADILGGTLFLLCLAACLFLSAFL